jgi:hypothetical protein
MELLSLVLCEGKCTVEIKKFKSEIIKISFQQNFGNFQFLTSQKIENHTFQCKFDMPKKSEKFIDLLPALTHSK